MNYRHAFHAGNFADVHKHAVLLELLRHLHKKPAPFFVLDTHAGRGLYDLHSTQSARGDEWRGGIGLVRAARAQELISYLTLVDQLTGSTARAYPGSPLVVAAMLRENDRAVFVEKHPEEVAALRSAMGRRKRISVLEDNGYTALDAHLPPKENRGLVLIDPPYEADSEFADVARALSGALQRWPNGMYCVWYPIKPGNAERRLHRALVDGGARKLLLATLNVRPGDSPLGLNGSGLLLANPPWQLDERLRSLSAALLCALAPSGGGFQVEWLVDE